MKLIRILTTEVELLAMTQKRTKMMMATTDMEARE